MICDLPTLPDKGHHGRRHSERSHDVDVCKAGARLKSTTLAREHTFISPVVFRLIRNMETANAIRQLSTLVPFFLAARPLMPVSILVAIFTLEGSEYLRRAVEPLAHIVSRQGGGDDGVCCVWIEVEILATLPLVGTRVEVPSTGTIDAPGLVFRAPSEDLFDVVARFSVVGLDLNASCET